MRNIIKLVIKIIGGIVALTGAIMVGWASVMLYYLISGRIEAGWHYPPIAAVVILFIIGMILLVAGFMANKVLPKSRI